MRHLICLAALALMSCGGDDKEYGPVSGPSPVAVLNCPGSGTGSGGVATPTTRIGGVTTVSPTCPTGRCGGSTFCSTCQSKSRRLNGIPVQGDNSVGDTRITNTFDCGDITVNEPAPVSPVVIQPVVITP